MIKHWQETERPRERLLGKGAQVLTDAELLAVLMRSGVRGKDAVALSRDLLAQCGGIRGLTNLSLKQANKITGLGPAKYASLMACFELGRRVLREKAMGCHVIREPQSVIQYLMASLQDKKREVFKVLFLNKANQLFDEMDLFEGTIDQSAVYAREVVKAALEKHATALVLVHNHPSGRAEPSADDRRLTQTLKEACGTVQIKILDHIIVGDQCHYSFREQNLL